jgi:nicotinamidase-related amidase
MFSIDPAKTALLVVDMQNDFVREGAPQEVPDARATIPVIQSLLRCFREAGNLVVYTKYVTGPKETLIWMWSPECAPPTCSCWPGVRRFYEDIGREAEGPDVVDELYPLADEPIVEKYGYDAFFNTSLHDILRSHHIDFLVVVGTVTQICVEDTVHAAFHRGYRTTVVSDGVSSYDCELHLSALRNISLKYGRVLDANTVLDELAIVGERAR